MSTLERKLKVPEYIYTKPAAGSRQLAQAFPTFPTSSPRVMDLTAKETRVLHDALTLSRSFKARAISHLDPCFNSIQELYINLQSLLEDTSSDLSRSLPPSERSDTRGTTSNFYPLSGHGQDESDVIAAGNAQHSDLALVSSAIQAKEEIWWAVQRVPRITNIIQHFQHAPRLQHIQSIYALQRRQPPKEIVQQDKLLLICASQSLAQDFRAFELQNGWSEKTACIAARILDGQQPDVQRTGKHLKNFVAAQQLNIAPQRAKFDAALRLGLKLDLVDRLSQEAGLGPSLSLLLGFQTAKFSRLSYSAIARMYYALIQDEHMRAETFQCLKIFDRTWCDIRSTYHTTYGQNPSFMHPTHNGGQASLGYSTSSTQAMDWGSRSHLQLAQNTMEMVPSIDSSYSARTGPQSESAELLHTGIHSLPWTPQLNILTSAEFAPLTEEPNESMQNYDGEDVGLSDLDFSQCI